jgi:hypothetical protein
MKHFFTLGLMALLIASCKKEQHETSNFFWKIPAGTFLTSSRQGIFPILTFHRVAAYQYA